jgi:hypothetical protein
VKHLEEQTMSANRSCRSWAVGALTLGLGLFMTSAAPAAIPLPDRSSLEQVSFERHVMGLLGRMGCNAGSCHGSFQGKGGFRLSLFGHDPEKDHAALTRDLLGRRINRSDPERSLLLLKATGQIEHGGGMRFARGSWQYQVFRQWIADGAPRHKDSGAVSALTISPEPFALIKSGEKERVRVQARFLEVPEEDVTAFCDFRVQDDAVAEVTPLGEVTALRPGDTVLVVSYRGHVRATRILVPMPAQPAFRYPDVPEVNYIDREVFAKLRRLNVVPSELSSDAEFLRRVTIDTIGCLPAPEEVRSFLADPSPDKRTKKIGELLAHPLHAALWATKLSDVTGNNTALLLGLKGAQQARYSQMWHDWLRRRLAANRPYDEIVHGILCATSRDGRLAEEWIKDVRAIEDAAQKGFQSPYADRASLDLYWRVGAAPTLEEMGEKTAAAFLGVRLECAQCHKHPFDRWTQEDYRAHANLFGQVAVGVSPECQALVEAENKARGLTGKALKGGGIGEVYLSPKPRALPHPASSPAGPATKRKGESLPPALELRPRILGGPEVVIEPGKDARLSLFEWLRSPDNPYFARCFVNRVWAHYFGTGLVDPVDNFSLANPPTNEPLLAALAQDFVEHHFDIRRLERTVLLSRVYQLSSEPNETNKHDRINGSHSTLRPLLAEAVVDVLNSALGITEDFGQDAPPGSRAIEVGSSRVQNASLAYAFRTFGRPARTTACDCERTTEPALAQTLYLMSDRDVLDKVLGGYVTVTGKSAKVYQETRLTRLLRKSGKDDDAILEELFLATLSRFPTEAEKKHFATFRAARKDVPAAPPADVPVKGKEGKAPARFALSARDSAFVDALWALINTREFLLNH